MENNVRAASYGDADRFGVTPAFVTDSDTKLQPACLENLPAGTGRIDRIF
jgi:hypothetical protein